jgi:hypothetical protein
MKKQNSFSYILDTMIWSKNHLTLLSLYAPVPTQLYLCTLLHECLPNCTRKLEFYIRTWLTGKGGNRNSGTGGCLEPRHRPAAASSSVPAAICAPSSALYQLMQHLPTYLSHPLSLLLELSSRVRVPFKSGN